MGAARGFIGTSARGTTRDEVEFARVTATWVEPERWHEENMAGV